jgi:hypothetical protein
MLRIGYKKYFLALNLNKDKARATVERERERERCHDIVDHDYTKRNEMNEPQLLKSVPS